MKELKVFDQLTSDIATLVEPVSKLKVIDFKSSETAVTHGRAIQVLLNEVESRRDSLVRPLNDQVKQINAYARDIKAPLDTAKRHLEIETGNFAAEQRRLKAIEDARIEAERQAEEDRIAAEAQAKLDALEADRAEAIAEMDPLFGSVEDHDEEFARQQAAIEAEAEQARMRAITTASTQKYDAGQHTIKGVRMVWDCELVDIDQVPVEYLERKLDRTAILHAARKGITNIPGIRMFQKPSVGFGQNTYVPRQAVEAEKIRDRAARVLSEPPRQGRRAPGTDAQPSRRAANPSPRTRATSGRRS